MNIKSDLATAIITGIIGVIVAYLVTNFFVGPIESFSYSTVDSTINAELIDPDPEVFNYRALNPTVEVYVGDCTEYNENGECINDTPRTLEEEAP